MTGSTAGRMTGPEHFQEAQRLLAAAAQHDQGRMTAENAAVYAARAQAHAALAQVSLAATLGQSDLGWPDVQGWSVAIDAA